MDPDAAPTGPVETTIDPRPYPFPRNPNYPDIVYASLYDFPGGATRRVPASDYIERFGLRYMHGIIIVIGERVTELDGSLIQYCHKNHIPYYVVRSMLDLSIMNNNRDYGKTKEQTLMEIHSYVANEVRNLDCHSAKSHIYVLSGVDNTLGDFQAFEKRIMTDSISALCNSTD